MYRTIRVIIAISVVLGLVLLARNHVAWAQPRSGANLAQAQPSVSLDDNGPDDDEGSVKPPPAKIKICKNGNYSLGGVATLKVKKLAPDYCIKGSLKNRDKANGRIPDGAGKILADVTSLQFLYKNRSISQLPEKDGQVQICYAVPPGKQAKLYFLSKKLWKPLQTIVENGIACAAAQTSGTYALIGK